jgi:excinuclease ABC subunit C
MEKLVAQKIPDLPKRPGIYIFKDAKGLVLYVGKAINLRSRVSSYLRADAGHGVPRIQNMITQITDLDYVITDNETESLILENNFIKQLKPKYNVLLRDDKNYLFIKINLQDEIPTIEYERKASDNNARYFGPYTSSQSIKETLRMLRRIFPYCANSAVGTKPCFYYHIQKCPGVCIGKISPAEYRKQTIDKIIRFLDGKQSEVLKELQGSMKYLAKMKEYEKAAKVRDQIFALNRVLERQKLVYSTKVSQDIFSLYIDSVAVVNLFMIREGKLIQ